MKEPLSIYKPNARKEGWIKVKPEVGLTLVDIWTKRSFNTLNTILFIIIFFCFNVVIRWRVLVDKKIFPDLIICLHSSYYNLLVHPKTVHTNYLWYITVIICFNIYIFFKSISFHFVFQIQPKAGSPREKATAFFLRL